MVWAAVLVAAYFFIGNAAAGGGDIALKAAKTHPGASGTLHLTDGSIRLMADGLKSGEVYTVWFVNMKPEKSEAGAGSPPYTFKADSKGKGIYEAALSEPPFGKWEMIMVVQHPDGNPSNMKNMVEALSAKIPQAG